MRSSKNTRTKLSVHHTFLKPQGIPRGFLRLYVLRRISANPAHGYDLLQEIASKTEGAWRPGPGSVYPILKELVSEGHIKAESPVKSGKQRVYRITAKGQSQLEHSGDSLFKAGQNWGAMRSIMIELVDPKNIPAMFTHMTSGQLAFLRGILELKRDKIPRKELQSMLKEYVHNLEKQLEWTRQMSRKA